MEEEGQARMEASLPQGLAHPPMTCQPLRQALEVRASGASDLGWSSGEAKR